MIVCLWDFHLAAPWCLWTTYTRQEIIYCFDSLFPTSDMLFLISVNPSYLTIKRVWFHHSRAIAFQKWSIKSWAAQEVDHEIISGSTICVYHKDLIQCPSWELTIVIDDSSHSNAVCCRTTNHLQMRPMGMSKMFIVLDSTISFIDVRKSVVQRLWGLAEKAGDHQPNSCRSSQIEGSEMSLMMKIRTKLLCHSYSEQTNQCDCRAIPRHSRHLSLQIAMIAQNDYSLTNWSCVLWLNVRKDRFAVLWNQSSQSDQNCHSAFPTISRPSIRVKSDQSIRTHGYHLHRGMKSHIDQQNEVFCRILSTCDRRHFQMDDDDRV
jgi:hypothetical protein